MRGDRVHSTASANTAMISHTELIQPNAPEAMRVITASYWNQATGAKVSSTAEIQSKTQNCESRMRRPQSTRYPGFDEDLRSFTVKALFAPRCPYWPL